MNRSPRLLLVQLRQTPGLYLRPGMYFKARLLLVQPYMQPGNANTCLATRVTWRYISLNILGLAQPIVCHNHRLRGSASTVLTATSQVNGRWRIFDPSQNRNPWADCNKIPHIWLRPRGDPLNQIWYKSIHWGLLGKWVTYNVLCLLFIYLHLFS